MPHAVMVSTTRSMTCLQRRLALGRAEVPRKYFWATMLVAFSDQPTGNSTPSCSKATVPSWQLVMRASRRSHSTLS